MAAAAALGMQMGQAKQEPGPADVSMRVSTMWQRPTCSPLLGGLLRSNLVLCLAQLLDGSACQPGSHFPNRTCPSSMQADERERRLKLSGDEAFAARARMSRWAAQCICAWLGTAAHSPYRLCTAAG